MVVMNFLKVKLDQVVFKSPFEMTILSKTLCPMGT
jgi:hypothetical protein